MADVPPSYDDEQDESPPEAVVIVESEQVTEETDNKLESEINNVPKDEPNYVPNDEPDIESEIKKKIESSANEEDGGRKDLYDADNDGIADEEMFEGSTHYFAIYYGYNKDVSANGLIIAYFVLIIQMILYITFAYQVSGSLGGDEFTIPVMVRFGKKCTETANLVCPPELPNLGFVALAAILLAFFLMHDIMACIRVFCTIPTKWSKFSAFIIFSEAMFAAIIGILFAVGSSDGYDAIANCIGVLFIHDVDEKAYEAFMIIKSMNICKNCENNKKCFDKVRLAAIFMSVFFIMVISLVVAAGIRATQTTQIKTVYGDDYYDNAFSSGYFNYDWGDTNDFTWDSNYYGGGTDTGTTGGTGGTGTTQSP